MTNSLPYYAKDFYGSDLYALLLEASSWLSSTHRIKIEKNKFMERRMEFYLVDVLVKPDEDYGWNITIYHGEIPDGN